MADDRGMGGRFVAGNQAAKGHGGWGKTSTLRKAALDSATPEMVQEVMETLFKLAIGGDTKAASIWLDRVGIRPESIDLEERLRTLEEQLAGGEFAINGAAR